jgi:PAS domain S-box-containing protein
MRTERVIDVLAAVSLTLGVWGLCVFALGLDSTFALTVNAMKPTTAVALSFVAVALLQARRARLQLAMALSLPALGLGVASLVVEGRGGDVVNLLAPTGRPLGMSLASAFGLTALSAGVVAFSRQRRGFAQLAAAAALCVAFVGVAGYTLGLTGLGVSWVWSTMALSTATSLGFASAALLGLTRDGPLARALLGDGLAARMGRRLVLLAVVVPWVAAAVMVRAGGDVTPLQVLRAAQGLVPVVVVLVAVVLRFTYVVARESLDLGVTLDSIGDAVLVTDAQGRVRRLNPVAERLTGWTSAEAEGRDAAEVFVIVNETTKQPATSPIERVLREGVVVGLANHTLLVDKQGVMRPISDSGAPVRGADGRVQGVVTVFRDMTAEHTKQRELERSEATLESVMNAMPLAVLALRDTTMLWANNAAATLFGQEHAEALRGRSLLDFTPPEDAQHARERLEALARGEALAPERTRVLRADAEVLVDTIPVAGEVRIDGVAARLCLMQTVANTTALEHRIARQASLLREVAELSRRLSRASFDLKQILDDTAALASPREDELGLVLVFSDQAAGGPDSTPPQIRARAFHATRPDFAALAARLVGTPILVGPVTERALKEDVLRLDGATIRKATSPANLEAVGDAPLDDVVFVAMRAHGQPVGMLVVIRAGARRFDDDDLNFLRDLADRSSQAVRNAQLFEQATAALEALKRTEAELRHSQKLDALGQLAGGIAHDFNNLLSIILTVVDLLLQGRGADDPDRADLEDVREAANRAASLTRQLLAFSRKQVLQLRPVSLNDIVKGMEGLLRSLLGEPVALELRLSPSAPVVRADATLLTQVVMNLCVNARDAMPRGGALTVETTTRRVGPGVGPSELSPGEYVCLAVSDSGVGIAPEVMERLFEPFFTTKGPGKGTGLGLSTSYGIVRQLGGVLTVASTPARGSTFVAWLPVSLDAVVEPTVREARALPSGVGVVLLVEDEDGVRDVATRVLTSAGYVVHGARGVREALEAVERLPSLDLLLTDVVLGDGNGRELADAVRARRPGLRVLFASGYTDDEVMRRGVRSGHVSLLAKPFTPAVLLDAVGDALRAPSAPEVGVVEHGLQRQPDDEGAALAFGRCELYAAVVPLEHGARDGE